MLPDPSHFCVVKLIVILICISLIVHTDECFFIFLWVVFMSSLKNCLFNRPYPFSMRLSCYFLLLSFENALYILSACVMCKYFLFNQWDFLLGSVDILYWFICFFLLVSNLSFIFFPLLSFIENFLVT